jgi:hypothetical protein
MSTWQDVIQRANTDPQFRNRLKANPAAAAKEMGFDVRPGTSIKVFDKSPNDLHLFFGTQTKSPEINRLLERVEKDADFKQQLLANPKRVVESALGQPLPPGSNVSVHDEEPNTIKLFISTASGDGEELSDAQLEAVAGGGFFKNVRDAVGDFFCRDQPIALTVVPKEGRVQTGVGYYTTRSGNIESADAGIYI